MHPHQVIPVVFGRAESAVFADPAGASFPAAIEVVHRAVPVSDPIGGARSQGVREVVLGPADGGFQIVPPGQPGRDGHWYAVRVMPYRTHDDVIQGAVITFVDITATKELEARLRAGG